MLWQKVHSKIAEREADQPPVSNADIKNRKSPTSTYPRIFTVIRVILYSKKNPSYKPRVSSLA